MTVFHGYVSYVQLRRVKCHSHKTASFLREPSTFVSFLLLVKLDLDSSFGEIHGQSISLLIYIFQDKYTISTAYLHAARLCSIDISMAFNSLNMFKQTNAVDGQTTFKLPFPKITQTQRNSGLNAYIPLKRR